MGEAIHDSRDAPVGSYAGTTTADGETVGSYAGTGHSGREAMGTFAGDADAQRRGGFSDVDRETVTTYAADVKRVRISVRRRLVTLLADADRDPRGAETLVAYGGRSRADPWRRGAPIPRRRGRRLPAAPERAMYNNALLERHLGSSERLDAVDLMEAAYASAGVD